MSNKFVREEINFLKGARGRWNELKYAIGVVFQFMKGFRTLHFVGPCVTVFGSARFGEDHPLGLKLLLGETRDLSILSRRWRRIRGPCWRWWRGRAAACGWPSIAAPSPRISSAGGWRSTG